MITVNKQLIEWDPIEIGSAQIDWTKMKIHMQREWLKHHITWLFWNETNPSFPIDAGKANFIGFIIKDWEMNITWMKVRDELRWTWIIDILFNTMWRVAELIDIRRIGSNKIKKPSTAKKLQHWWFIPVDEDPILGEINSFSDMNIPRISLYKPARKEHIIMRNFSRGWEYHFYEITNTLLSPPKWDSFPLQEKMFLNRLPDTEELLKRVNWKYRLSETKINQFTLFLK